MPALPTVLELTRDLVRIDSVNPPGSERACAHLLGLLLESNGYATRYHEFAPGRTCVVASIGGRSGRAPIALSGHLDTVAFGAQPWERAPLAAEIDGGRVFGRGTTDMKAGVAAMVAAAVQLAPQLAKSVGIALVLTAGEETGCLGAQFLARRPELLGDAGAIVVGEPTSNALCLGHKGVLRIEARTHGVTAHGSMPERGVNAIYKASRAVQALQGFSMPGTSHPIMGQATLNVGTIHGGVNVNTVPDEVAIGIDIRSVPGVSHDQILEKLRGELGDDVTLCVTSSHEPVYTEPSHPWLGRIEEVVASVTGTRPAPKTMSYFTDAAALRGAYGNPPAIILGPGEPELAHQTNEYCWIERIEEALAIYRAILVDWCEL